MAYTVPTSASIKARFPEFASLDDSFVDAIILEAGRWIDTSWLEADYTIAYQYLVAHMIKTDPSQATGVLALPGSSGAIQSYSLGDASVSFADVGSGGGSGGALSDAALAKTEYGRRFSAMRRANRAGARVV